SISSSRRWLKNSAAAFGPSVTSSTAALRRPLSLQAVSPGGGLGRVRAGGGSTASASSGAASASTSRLLHPRAQLLCDAVGLERRQLLGVAAAAVVVAVEPLALQLGERRRRVELAQPDRLRVEPLLLAPAQVAAGEEEEQQRAERERHVLGAAEDAADRSG